MQYVVAGDAKQPPYNIRADLIYCDPPTNNGVNEGNSSDHLSWIDYQVFCLTWLQACYRMLKFDSRLVLCLHGERRRLFEHLIHINFPQLRFEQEIIWAYNFGLYTRRRFVPSHDNILVFKQGKPKFYWKQVAIPSQRMEANDWRADLRGRTPGTVWDIPRVPGNSNQRRFVSGTKRSCQPEELCTRILLAFTKEGDTVYDPFAGTGTMGVVCKKNKRTYFGQDICEFYAQDSWKRIKYEEWMEFIDAI